LRANFLVCDVLRIDHFRGFDSYWAIPANAANAKRGSWQVGPGLDFFAALRKAIPGAKLIAEDLGELTPSVTLLREATGLPGMTILQFAFGGDAKNIYLPHYLRANNLVYPGTHDNDTSLGWYQTAPEYVKDHVRRYLRITGQETGWDFIRTAYESVSNLAIFPLQDLMSLGSEARFNTPGKATGNWQWRYRVEQLSKLQSGGANYLHQLGDLYGRLRSPTLERTS
jgi:4-alpha-glucanotransferase